MKKLSLSIFLSLATLVFFTPSAYSAAPGIPATWSVPNMPSALVMAETPALLRPNTRLPVARVMLHLLNSKMGYLLNESTAILLVCSSVAPPETEGQGYQPTRNLFVNFRFSY